MRENNQQNKNANHKIDELYNICLGLVVSTRSRVAGPDFCVIASVLCGIYVFGGFRLAI